MIQMKINYNKKKMLKKKLKNIQIIKLLNILILRIYRKNKNMIKTNF